MGKFSLHIGRKSRFCGMMARLRDYETNPPEVPRSRSPEIPKSKTTKTLITYLAVLLAIGLSACKERTEMPETRPCEKAALELYCKYADNENLTVAYLGDLSIHGKCIDALMLQANDEMDWETLKRDFGMMPYDSDVFNCPSDDNPVMVGVGIETDFLDDAIFDTLTDISQIPDEDIEKYTLVVANKIREIMNSFQTPDSLLPSTAIIIGQGEIEHEATDNTYDDYILTVSRAVVIGIINERIHDSQNNTTTASKITDLNDRIMDDAQTHGHIGYITAADHDNRTLWLFFYDDQEECNTIITHIREDLIVNE